MRNNILLFKGEASYNSKIAVLWSQTGPVLDTAASAMYNICDPLYDYSLLVYVRNTWDNIGYQSGKHIFPFMT